MAPGRAHRKAAALTVTLLTVLPLAGCGLFSSDGPEDTLAAFLTAVGTGDVAGAAARTDSPDAAKTLLTQVRTALKPESIDATDESVKKSGDTATGGYRLTWHLPKGRTWTYTSDAQLRSTEDGWQVHWQPTVVHPQLAPQQSIAIEADPAEPAPVLDRDGFPLLRPQTVIGVVVDPAKTGNTGAVASKLGSALHRFEPTVTGRSVLDGIKATKPGSAYPVLSLRDTDYEQVKPTIYDLPGVRFTSQERLLPDNRDTGRQILPVLRTMVEQQAAGGAGWRIVSLDVTGSEASELYAVAPKAPPAVTSTLSTHLQTAAEQALAPVKTAAALVALQPSTGQLLAVAQNEPADEQGPLALTGRFPPGSTFKIVTATAALGAGRVKVDSPVACPGTTTFEGRLVPNEGRFDLGTVPLAKAFAQSCNTTFAQLSAGLSPTALTDAARSLGIGADFVIPGLTTVTGSVPPAGSVVQRAENGFGQGTVVTSPFGMALAAAAVQSGKVPTPSLVRGQPGKVTGLGPAPRPEVLDAVRSMMRDVVTTGTATGLRDLPDVRGKTGTAQFGDGTHSHGWFVGYQGDLAFAVLLTDAGSSKPAVEAAHRFLAGVAAK
ncbi:penicillin-binding transpeptidase domain-containing protein [Amycolatopsis rhabdoformis]|uniref:Penicillin-binding transpeptidase domain-containing protein n=1 Tax=Amycolatopsis rhabdoformis TaxID=1448059 RepID=A0ABZ1I7R1_9PSEU|nr:penicillin-binding transpeptidase domain-containing protein [Amycolatopsis rhabdoformis]WSE30466.1 penicillin-binding transpeptidase domain-containing protein [Amycolatopsis rhabdoformis]